MNNNLKYPSTPYFSFSPSISKKKQIFDDTYIYNFINKKIIITEKLDGSNACLHNNIVYARSHQTKAICKSFDLLKSKYAEILSSNKIDNNIYIFGENMYAIHAIEYTKLDDVFYVFSIFKNDIFLSWYDVTLICKQLNLKTVPVLFSGIIKSMGDFKDIIFKEMDNNSVFGGNREGLVVRIDDYIPIDKFNTLIAKCVRKNHVKTNIHWSINWKRSNICIKNS